MFSSILDNIQTFIALIYPFVESYHLPLFLMILLLMVIFFIFEILPMEVTALATIGMLWACNILTIEECLPESCKTSPEEVKLDPARIHKSFPEKKSFIISELAEIEINNRINIDLNIIFILLITLYIDF